MIQRLSRTVLGLQFTQIFIHQRVTTAMQGSASPIT